MKLFELMQPNTIRKVKQFNGPIRPPADEDPGYMRPVGAPMRHPTGSGLKFLGGGVQGYAYKKVAAGSVVKYFSVFDPKKNGYLRFLRYVSKLPNNPFLPRIYNLKLYDVTGTKFGMDSNERFYGVLEMEKLIKVNDSMIIDVVPDLFRNIGLEFSEHALDYFSTGDHDTKRHILDKEVQKAVYNPAKMNIDELIAKSTNEQFTQALRVISGLLRKCNVTADLHAGNWMVRLTGSGPQLVILDPVWGEDW